MDPTIFSKLSLRDRSPEPTVLQEIPPIQGASRSIVASVSSPAGAKKRSGDHQSEGKPDIWQSTRVLAIRSLPRPKEEKMGSDDDEGGVSLKDTPGFNEYANAANTRHSTTTRLKNSGFRILATHKGGSGGSLANVDSRDWFRKMDASTLVSTNTEETVQTQQQKRKKRMRGAKGSISVSLDPTAPDIFSRDPMSIDEASDFSALPPGHEIRHSQELWSADPPINEPISISNIIGSSQRYALRERTAISSRLGPDAGTFTTKSSLSPRRYPQRDRTVAHPPTLAPRPVPEPDAAYILQCHQAPRKLAMPQHLLLVLDLNGTLVFRRGKGGSSFTARPFLREFLEYCFENHSVFVWSSAKPENVRQMCAGIFTPTQRKLLVAEWSRDTLELTLDEYHEKIQVYKRLDRIWEIEGVQLTHPDFARGGRWSQANTILIDDSLLKASTQPYNHIEIPEYLGVNKGKMAGEKDILAQVVAYLEEARQWNDVSCFVRQQKFQVDQGYIWDWEKAARDDDDTHPGKSQASRKMLGVYIPPPAT